MADGDFNLATLWVPVVPETSKVGPAMEEAGKEAKGRFGSAVSGIGDSIHDSISHATDKLKDVFGKSGGEASKSFTSQFNADALGEALGGELGKALGGALREIPGVGGALDTAREWGEAWVGASGHAQDGIQSLRSAVTSLKGGDVTGALGGITDLLGHSDTLAKSVGVDISGWTGPIGGVLGPLQGVVDKAKAAQTDIKGFADTFVGLPGIIGKVGAAISELAGPIATAMAAGHALDQYAAAHFPGAAQEQATRGKGDAHTQAIWDEFHQLPGRFRLPGGPVESSGPLPPDMAVGGNTGGSDSGYSSLFGAGGSGIGGAGAAFSGDTVPSALVPRDVGSGKGLTPTSAEVKKVVSTMFPQITDIGGWRPPDGYNEHSSGHALDVMIPNAGTPQGKALGDQIKNYVLQHSKELGVDYALWQQTQWNPGGTSSPMENRGGFTQNHMDHVHIHTAGAGSGDLSDLAPPGALGSGGGGGGLGPSGVGQGPIGTSNDPVYTAQADSGTGGDGGASGGAGGAGGQGNSQAEQLGKGLVNGVLQEFGLDGSVFKGFGGSSNPLQFGSVKAGMGLLNFGLGMAQHSQGAGGMGGVGGGGGIPGMGMIPTGPGGGAQNVSGDGGGDTYNFHGPVGGTTINGVGSVQEQQWEANRSPPSGPGAAGSRYASLGNVPSAGAGLNP